MKKFTLLLSALAMTVASWAAIPEDAIIIAVGSPGARNYGKYMGIDANGVLTTVNTIDESSLWVRGFNEETGGETISNVSTKGYLYTEIRNDQNFVEAVKLSETPVDLTIVDSEVLPGAYGISIYEDANATGNLAWFLNALNIRAGIGTWSLDEGSSFYFLAYDPQKTTEQVDEEVNNLYYMSNAKKNAITAVNKYMTKSWGGRVYGDSNLINIENAETDEELQEAIKSATQAAIIYAETSLKDGATLFNSRAQKTVGIFTDSINCPIQRMDQGIDASCLWFAEMVTTDEEIVVNDYTFQQFYLRNALTGKYIGKNLTNIRAVLPVDSKDEAAIVRLVMESDGFMMITTNNGYDKQYFNVSNNDGDPKLTYYPFDGDSGAYFEFNKLPMLESGLLPTAIGLGEAEYDMYQSLTGIEIAVPADYEPSGLGGVKLVSNGMDENLNWTVTTHASWTPEQLAAITPETKTVEIKHFDFTSLEFVTESVEAKVYTLTFAEPFTAPANYRLTVDEYTFRATVDDTTGFSNFFGGSFEVKEPAEPIEPATVDVTPVAGTYDAITTITIDPKSVWSIGASVGEITVTFNGEITTDANGTELKLDGDAIWAYDAYDWDTEEGGFEIPVNFTTNGKYVLTIPEGFFESSDSAPNAETIVEWTVDDQSGIREITSLKINGKAYDLKGRAVANPAKGLFIIDGKKVIK